MPRRPADHPRYIIKTCRFSPDEDAQLTRRAEAAGFGHNISAFIRASALTTHTRRSEAPDLAKAEGVRLAPPPSITGEEYRTLLELIRRAGVNLNQLARYANERHGLPPDVEREFRTALAEVRHVVRLAQPL